MDSGKITNLPTAENVLGNRHRLISMTLCIVSLGLSPQVALAQDGHATRGDVEAELHGDFSGLFVASNKGGQTETGPLEGRTSARIKIQQYNYELNNRGDAIHTYCQEDWHAISLWNCLFDTVDTIDDGIPRVTPQEAHATHEASTFEMWLDGEEITDLYVGRMKRFNPLIILDFLVGPHAFTMPVGATFSPAELELGDHTLRLRITTDRPVATSSPTTDTDMNPLRTKMEGVVYDNTFLFEIAAHGSDPDYCSARDD